MDTQRKGLGEIMPIAILNSTLTITDVVQGVTQWLVEHNINDGGYTTVSVPELLGGDESGFYLCPSSPNVQTEIEAYSFAYREVITSEDFSIDDTIQWRFTPAGYDEGNGSPFESDLYIVGSSRVKGGCGFIQGFNFTL